MPKIIDYEKRKEEISRKALSVFVEKGYYNTSLADISERCGIGRTTLYRYFKNKDEIFQFTIASINKIIKADLQSVLEDENISFIEKIKVLIEKLFKEYKNSGMLTALIDYRLVARREKNNYILKKIQESMQGINNALKQLLSEGIRSKEIKPVDKEKMTITLYALLESLVLNIPIDKVGSIDEHLKAVNILIDGLKL